MIYPTVHGAERISKSWKSSARRRRRGSHEREWLEALRLSSRVRSVEEMGRKDGPLAFMSISRVLK